MKTHEFARYLQQLAKLLRSLPDTELDFQNTAMFKSMIPGIANSEALVNRRPRGVLPDGIQEKLNSMSPSKIEAYLSSQEENFSVGELLELTKRIGVTASKRQSKSALINLITRYYEALNMHTI